MIDYVLRQQNKARIREYLQTAGRLPFAQLLLWASEQKIAEADVLAHELVHDKVVTVDLLEAVYIA